MKRVNEMKVDFHWFNLVCSVNVSPRGRRSNRKGKGQAVLDTVHVTNFVQSRHCRWRTDSFSFVRVVSSIFFAFRRLTSGLRLYFLEKFE